jgi:hypothetical protein
VEIIKGNGLLRFLSPNDLETARNSPNSEILEIHRHSILTTESNCAGDFFQTKIEGKKREFVPAMYT